ncbi:MAG: nuclear transport factor 2 family protein [Candidatus Limnocylindrales bacterium]
MNYADVQAWLDRYDEAWQTYRPDAIGDLFSADAEYRYHPWDEPIVGRAAIVADWLNPDGDPGARDQPGSFTGHYQPWLVTGDRAVAVGTSDYRATGDAPARLYHNAWLLEFDGEGRCRSFTEYYNLQRREPGGS